MLFLAVFCGFIAENIREHQVEYKKEKKFMQSLIADIGEDTIEINKSISAASKAKQYQDSALFYLYNNFVHDQIFYTIKNIDPVIFFGLKELSSRMKSAIINR